MNTHSLTRKMVIYGITTFLAVLMFNGSVMADDELPSAEPEAAPPAAAVAVVDEPADIHVNEAEVDVPSPEPPAEAAPAPVEEPQMAEELSEETSVESVIAPVEDQPAAEVIAEAAPENLPVLIEEAVEEIALEPSVEQVPLAQVVAEIVENDIQVVDENGEELDMASQESAQILAGSDPRWQVGTQWYSVATSDGGCYPGSICMTDDDPIQYAIDWIAGDATKKPTNGLIYVESDTYNYNVTIDGTIPNLSNLKGLIGVASGGIFPTINGNVQVNNLLSGFTLSGFEILGGLTIEDCSGTLMIKDLDISNGSGINVLNHKGNVELANVNSHDNDGDGAHIDNLDSTGNVKVTNSSFCFNSDITEEWTGHGLHIRSSHAVTLDGIIASHNNFSGIQVSYYSALTIKNTVANYNEDLYGDRQTGFGINAYTDKAAPVTLENVTANYNSVAGIAIETKGSLTARNLEAQYNTVRHGKLAYYDYEIQDYVFEATVEEYLSDDVEYDEWYFYGDAGQEVNIILHNMWNDDFDPLVRLYDDSGVMLFEDDNSYDGYLNAQILDYLPADGDYYIRVYGQPGGTASQYRLSLNDEEEANSIWILNGGFEYYGNAGSGVFNLTNAFFNKNGGDGLYVENKNTVNISSIVSQNNGGSGIDVDKTGTSWDCSTDECEFLGAFGLGTVTITSPVATGWLTANIVSGNGNSGVYVESKGNILVSNIDSYENGSDGLYLDNCLKGLGGSSDGCLGVGTVTLNVTIPNWYNSISANSGVGIEINSIGNVLVNKSWPINNGSEGIIVHTLGTINLSSVHANDNYSLGAHLDNLGAPYAKTVTVSDSTFNNNLGTGLDVLTKGAILVSGTSASENNSPSWSYLDQIPVSVLDFYNSDNYQNGYSFYAEEGQVIEVWLTSGDFDAYLELVGGEDWTIVASDDNSNGGTDAYLSYTIPVGQEGYYYLFISDVDYDTSGGYLLKINDEARQYMTFPASGAVLDNSIGIAGVTVTTTAANPYSQFDANDNMGLLIKSNGLISVSGAGASQNYRTGLVLDNPDSLAAVIVQDRSANPQTSYDDNGANGLDVRTRGAITLFGVSASRNGESGAYLDNCLYDEGRGECIGTGALSIGSASGRLAYFDENSIYGIYGISKGNITQTNISACSNGADGVFLVNRRGTSIGNVTVNAVGGVTNLYNNNGSDPESEKGNNGLTISSRGNITVSNVIANNNQNEGGGICLQNYLAPILKTVTVTNIVANENDWNGLFVYAKGNIILKNAQASDNVNEGAYLNNHIDGTAGNITVSFLPGGINIFNNNNGTGLLVDTYGIASISNIYAAGNFLTHGILDWYSDESGKISMRDYYNASKGVDTWEFTAEEGELYSIRLDSEDFEDDDWNNPFGFDPYLQLFDASHNLIASSNDDGGFNNALIEFTPVSDGLYYLEVSSAVEADGYYTLSLNDPTHVNDIFRYESSGVWIQAQKYAIVSGDNRLLSNSSAGLTISTPGNITISGNMEASWNGTQGLDLRNCWGTGNITLSGTTVANENKWQGVYAETSGLVSISNLTVNKNGLHGLNINAEENLKTVTLRNIVAQFNGQDENTAWGGYGILVYAQGKITLTSVKAWFNFTDGAKLDSNNNPVQVTLSSFLLNNEDGLEIVHGSGLLYTSGNVYIGNTNQNYLEY